MSDSEVADLKGPRRSGNGPAAREARNVYFVDRNDLIEIDSNNFEGITVLFNVLALFRHARLPLEMLLDQPAQ